MLFPSPVRPPYAAQTMQRGAVVFEKSVRHPIAMWYAHQQPKA
jgi:hypothetical protein